jgi:hypothetical protein
MVAIYAAFGAGLALASLRRRHEQAIE